MWYKNFGSIVDYFVLLQSRQTDGQTSRRQQSVRNCVGIRSGTVKIYVYFYEISDDTTILARL